MKKNRITSLIVFCMNISFLLADEGMWLLPFIEDLNMNAMEELGCELTAEEIYSINNSSIKDAVVIFGGGCTGEIVSGEGLLFTNHHCGFDEIQKHSTVENNILNDGFWAMSREEELPNPDLEVKFLIRIEEVTNKILPELSDTLPEKDRRDTIKRVTEEIVIDASQEDQFEAVVKPFFAGNKYYLFVYEVFRDVRLVGTPPSSIGKFGYDTDNWVWPRHTGDFSIFRVYTAPDGSPADYSPENIPLKPKHFLPISLQGINNGDFAFIIGYPGRTHRYLNSFGVTETMSIINEIRIKIRGVRQEILQQDMLDDPKVRIQYAAKYSRSSNYWKYSIGQNRGLKRLNIINEKRDEEISFQKWAVEDSLKNKIYGNILHDFNTVYLKKKDHENNFQYLNEGFFKATEIFDFISEFHYLYMMLLLNGGDNEELTEEIDQLHKITKDFYTDYNISTDMKVAKAMIKLYQNDIPSDQQPDFYSKINGKFRGNIDKYVDKMFNKTFFIDEKLVLEFLEDPEIKTLTKDPGFQTTNSIFKKYYEEYLILDELNLELEKLERIYMQGRMEMDPDKVQYPDANSTIRLTYGVAKDYYPCDAVHYDYKTFLKGVIEKEDTSNFEFLVPDRLKELYIEEDYGVYGEEEKLPVCFITDNDITGGNSGSPVLNKNGELIGLAFDGNWEAMSGDIAFEPNLQRCICVDIRYVLFIIEKFADAGHLIEELKLVP